MSTEDLSVRVRLLEARKAQQDAERTGKAIGKIGHSAKMAGVESQRASRHVSGFGRTATGLKSALAFTGVGGLAFGVKDLVTSGIAWQKQQAQLQNALGKTAGGMRELKAVNEAIDKTSAHGGFAGAEETQAISRFTILTGSATEALRLNQAAINLARGANISYTQAQKLLSGATIGQARGLQKLVGVITPVTTNMDALRATTKNATPEMLAHAKALDKQATATEAVRSVTEKFGGSTDAYGKTAAGALSNAGNAFDALKEKIGVEFLPIVTRGAQDLTKFVGQIQTGTGAGGEFADELKTIGKTVLPPLKAMIQIGGAVLKFVGHHPALAKVAGDLIAVGLAVKAIRFAGALTGISSLLTGLRRVPGVARRATLAVEKLDVAEAAGGGIGAGALGGRGRRGASALGGGRFGSLKSLAPLLAGPEGLVAYEIADKIAKPLYGKLGDLIFGKGNAFTEESHRSTFNVLGGPFTPSGTSATDTFTGRSAAQQRNRMLDPNYRAWLRRHHHAMGGLIPGLAHSGAGDTQLGMLAPGEFVLRRQVVQAVGAQSLHRLNQGGQTPDGQQWHVEPGITRVYIGDRMIAEAATKYALKRQARRS